MDQNLGFAPGALVEIAAQRKGEVATPGRLAPSCPPLGTAAGGIAAPQYLNWSTRHGSPTPPLFHQLTETTGGAS